ncbi:hypothetical protein B484DRAFT_449889 [Ochromonadaceae sp. CCMP2298]|nr:hypothetical protein B484DRAFT_449889 [Ochromonadaceae sp. CCMP2298]|mmetsp:Transcript_32919/g.72490  ORF Transcript_32919/g.72490 Transcript_32919/m.72490 type:complete len:163 (+) Transcript_32919:66-554(+)
MRSASIKPDRIVQLELQVSELKATLERKTAMMDGPEEEKSRQEVSLSQQLNEAYSKMDALTEEIAATETLIADTQDRLAASEAEEGPSQDLSSPSRGAEGDDVGEREKNLKLLLDKAKLDKDKAIRILIKIAGKNVVEEFLEHHAGAPDILDLLEEHLLEAR